ncbi:MAG TPA: BON domain-containing protein [Candidatus Eisenbacteria bacterium]|nr:BON domain-containing protein [Candidatus Eisenbacteria bacterium]
MVKDSKLQNDVVAELEWEPGVNAAHIGVSARSGAVALTGHVRTYEEKALARRAAMRVYGVRSVADDIEVTLAPEHARDDADIAEAVSRVLEWNAAIPEGVQARVSNAVVTLTGTTESAYYRSAAEAAVRQLVGVRSVVNAIAIKPKVSSRQVQAKISEALHRLAQLDARRIRVETHDGTVVLRGQVRSREEAEAAERAAAAAPGIAHVESHLEVTP